jgi:hypothetical protein
MSYAYQIFVGIRERDILEDVAVDGSVTEVLKWILNKYCVGWLRLAQETAASGFCEQVNDLPDPHFIAS